MSGALKAAVAYFAIVFAAGFVLGAIRTIVLVPRLGAPAAVLIELPFMLAIAWFVCRWLVGSLAVGPRWTGRVAMGVVAFALLMLAELALSVAAFGGTAASFVAALGTPAGAVGLAGQVAFAAMPLFVKRTAA